ncbi:MAG TPA: hypothetical protein VM695_10240 [Phycisphaerae bacterium]|nr:hypothetical protein [Phycisphaerae bacterium]
MDEHTEVTLPADLAEAVRAELAPDEKLLWCAQPRPDLYLRRLLPLALFLALGMAVSAVVFLVLIWHIREPMLTIAFLAAELPGVPLLVLMAVLVRRRGRATAYLVTDRRAAVLIEGLRRGRASFSPAELGELRVKRRPDGSGDVLFPGVTASRKLGGILPGAVGFCALDDVDAAERLLRDLARNGGR